MTPTRTVNCLRKISQSVNDGEFVWEGKPDLGKNSGWPASENLACLCSELSDRWSSLRLWPTGGSNVCTIGTVKPSYLTNRWVVYSCLLFVRSFVSSMFIFLNTFLINFKFLLFLIYRFLRHDHHSRPRLFFNFRSCDPWIGPQIKKLNCYTSFIIEPLDFKLHWMILDWRLHYCTIWNFLISSHGNQKRGWRWKMHFV